MRKRVGALLAGIRLIGEELSRGTITLEIILKKVRLSRMVTHGGSFPSPSHADQRMFVDTRLAECICQKS